MIAMDHLHDQTQDGKKPADMSKPLGLTQDPTTDDDDTMVDESYSIIEAEGGTGGTNTPIYDESFSHKKQASHIINKRGDISSILMDKMNKWTDPVENSSSPSTTTLSPQIINNQLNSPNGVVVLPEINCTTLDKDFNAPIYPSFGRSLLDRSVVCLTMLLQVVYMVRWSSDRD